MTQQTVERRPVRIPVEPLPILREIAAELSAEVVPSLIWADDSERGAAEYAARRCVLRYPDGVQIALHMESKALTARPAWPDAPECRERDYRNAHDAQPGLEMRQWSPRIAHDAVPPIISMSNTKPAGQLAREITRRLLLPLSKLWPNVAEQHRAAVLYAEKSLQTALLVQHINATTAGIRDGRFYTRWTRSGFDVNVELHGLTIDQARRLESFVESLRDPE